MSCSSPFEYVLFEESVSHNYTLSCGGSISVGGYTTPSTPESCVTLDGVKGGACSWIPGSGGQCSWNGCSPITAGYASCSPIVDYTYPSCTPGIPGIQIWPDFTISGSVSIPLKLELADGVSISLTGEETTETSSVTVYDFDITISVDGNSYSLPISLGSDGITFSQRNGEFSVSIPLGDLSDNIDIATGITFSMDLTFTLLLCLDPVPPEGWVDLQVSAACSLSVDGIDYSTSFALALPIVSAEEA